MAERDVVVTTGGIGDWRTPVRVSDDLSRAAYEAHLMMRVQFEDGEAVHLKTRFAGIDDVQEDGRVPAGFGLVEAQDADGDWLRGRIDWFSEGDVDRGTYTFSSGTGKWRDVDGTVDVVLFALPEDLDGDMPPTKPIRFYGFFEGVGKLSLPHFTDAGEGVISRPSWWTRTARGVAVASE